jgi:hypothetical protein
MNAASPLALSLLALATPQDDPIGSAIASTRPTAAEERWRLVPWLDSVTEALERARREQRPVFLFGYDGDLDTGNC